MSSFQQLVFSGAAQPFPPASLWEFAIGLGYNNTFYTSPSYTSNFTDLYPGSNDFCWEAWVKSSNTSEWSAWYFGGSGPGSALGLQISSSDAGATWSAVPYITAAGGTPTAAYAMSGWTHIAINRQGTTVNTYIGGQLSCTMTGITANLDAATIVSTDMFMFGGPVGDRDQNYAYLFYGNVRNIRYVIGDSVYGSVSSFTPPSLFTDIPIITGTQFVFWPANTSFNDDSSIYSDNTPVVIFNNYRQGGDGIANVNYVVPGEYVMYPPNNGGTTTNYPYLWTPSGTPAAPAIITNGPALPWSNNTCNMTMSGTDVRIATSTNVFAMGNNNFTFQIWFYMPDYCSNEMKTLIYTAGTGGFVMRLGRPGQGIDWLSIADASGTELWYGEVVWARNQWNYLVVIRSGTSVAVYTGPPDANYAYAVPGTDTGFGAYNFTGTGPTSIGCEPDSSISCQLYIGQIFKTPQVWFPLNVIGLKFQEAAAFTGMDQNQTLLDFKGPAGGPIWSNPSLYSTPPLNPVATVTGPTTVSVAFDPPTYDNTSGYNYIYHSSPDNVTGGGAASPITVTGLTPGVTYTFTGQGASWLNDGGGPYGETSNAVTPQLIGELYAWGEGQNGQIGQGSGISANYPLHIDGGFVWAAVASGYNFSVGTKTDGTLWSWGVGSAGGLGLGNTDTQWGPGQVGALTNWLRVAAGQYHVAAVKTNGTLWTWGTNTQGQLGQGNTTSCSSPIQVGTDTNWKSVTANSSFTVALKTDGTLWSWGQNNRGQLGLGNTTSYSSPVQIGALSTWRAVSAGYYHVAATATDGSLWSWGYNAQGQLGNNSTSQSFVPVITGSFSDWSKIVASGDTTLGIRNGGTLWAWGNNNNGQLGQGDTTNRSVPTQIGALTTWQEISIGGAFGSDTSSGVSAYGIRLDGTLWAWGNNAYGQLGGSGSQSSPTQVGTSIDWRKIFAGQFFVTGISNPTVAAPAVPTNIIATVTGSTSVEVTFDPGMVPATSFAVRYSPGNGTVTGSTRTIAITGLTSATTYTFYVSATNSAGTSAESQPSNPATLTTIPSAPLNVTATTAGTTSISVAFSPPSSTGGLPITNYTVTVSPGGATASGASSPITVTGLTQGTTYTFTVKATNSGGTGPDSAASNAAIPNGTLYAWGYNVFGQIGQGSTAGYSAPTQITGTVPWLAPATTYSNTAGAIRSDGTLWTWGRGDLGELGVEPPLLQSNSPLQVGALTNWRSIQFGAAHAAAVKTDGTLWTWGENILGQLGHGNTTNYNSPKQVGVLTSWLSVAAGRYSTYAIRTNGALYGWGSNASGGLGQGDTIDQSLPVQIGLTSNWTAVIAGGWTSVAALQSNGTLWTWGSNFSGALGLGDTTNRSVVTQVGALTNWRTVSSYGGSMTATKTDSSMWVWGSNGSGALGLGDTTNRSSPVQAGTYTGWYQAGVGFGVKGDGTLWTWGIGSSGVNGLGNITNYSSPKQVGTYRWTNASRSTFMLALPMLSVSTAPTAPINVTATALTGASATVSWTPTSFPVYSYTVTASPGGATQSSNGATVVFTGLGAGQPYTFTVTATNPVGTSAASSPSNSVTLTQGGLFAKGVNTYGQLGLGNNTNQNTMTQIGALTTWQSVAGGESHSAAIRGDGTLWTWGRNNEGQLGLGNTTYYNSPKQVGALTTWASVTCGQLFTVATRTDGTVWSWGYNNFGQLGLGNTTRRSSPVQIGALANWSQVSAGFYHVLAIKTDGTLWSWGYGGTGQLGLNNTSSYSSPKQVNSLTNWLAVSAGSYHSMVLNTSGRVSTCGEDVYGQLGYGSIGGTNWFFGQLGGTWSKISAGNRWSMGIQSNGTLWTWGYNNVGQLGQGNTTNSGAPLQVGALNTWINLAQGSCSSQALAMQTQSALWQWGNCFTANFSSPVQVGSGIGWMAAAAEANATVAIQGQ